MRNGFLSWTNRRCPRSRRSEVLCPADFFIYKAEAPEELIYANREVLRIYGCKDLAEFKALTGFAFRGMVYPDDYADVSVSIMRQISEREDRPDHAEYRIIRRDGAVRRAGPRNYRIDFGKVKMPHCRTGVMMGFRDVDDEIRQERAKRITVPCGRFFF